MPALLRRGALAALVAAAALGAGAASGTGAALAPAFSVERLSCVAPTDAVGLGRVLGGVGGPLADEAGSFVAAGQAAGLDPRALVAIAAHETLLETYPPAQLIHNPFGLGPGWRFRSERDAILTAARTLRDGYLSQGLTLISTIGAKWAPLGAANDPEGLNQSWTSGVSTYYTALGGDPSRPVLLTAQQSSPACAAPSPGAGPSVVFAWSGRSLETGGPRMDQGGDPVTGLPASVPDFVFPLAVPNGASVGYHDGFSDPGDPGCYGRAWRCAIDLQTAPRVTVVAATAGVLVPAGAADRHSGIAFWIDRGGGERLGYSGLAAYADGIGAGARVTPGQPLGSGTGSLLVAWTRDGLRINPYHLLRATRPSDA
jgi:hypothetical protein